ncbi:MAG: hypothetical protein ABIJ09_27220 [Pseudomonadota bacterium]
MDVGRMVMDGPYSGTEGMHFALRVSPGWTWYPQLPSTLRGLSLAEDLPGTGPGVGGDRDDPRRGFLRWRVGKDGDSLHFELGLLQTTLGHGSLVNLYQNSPEGAPLAFGLVAEGQLKGGGLTLVLGDALQPARLLAGRLRLKPLNIILSPDSALEPNDLNVDPRAAVFGMLIVGFTAVTDLDAPVTREGVDADGVQVPGRGARPMSAFGLDIETPPVDLGILHLNPYVDGVMLMGRGDGPGFGLHPGVGVGTDFFGIYWQLSLQYVLGTRGYKPWYYDSRYVFERLRTVADDEPKASRLSPAPAAQGYVGTLSAQLADTVSAWAEISDRIPFDAADGHSYGRARIGATAGPTMANVTVSLLREGWREYDRVFTDDGLSAVVVQGKLSVLFVGLIARYTHSVERNIDNGERFAVDDFSVGTEFGWSL